MDPVQNNLALEEFVHCYVETLNAYFTEVVSPVSWHARLLPCGHHTKQQMVPCALCFAVRARLYHPCGGMPLHIGRNVHEWASRGCLNSKRPCAAKADEQGHEIDTH